ncbi:hypothetical protein HG535_0B04940 [Zygotorulaspora mrakii]|uniref:Peptidase M20 dimerisation domain-containing protein n=1 Tax=Zygotorulaspora mrakii TaxID=42260 RepID=A0A7H9B0Z4_ZYGMR|nr:uncharacterized protein HG535_0B04940 [Zygotorulaspora mrakii]QLG71452.1 hypothetical protein HG535_0B04940 [Zygotorulaspora mrakii]
MEEKSDLSPLDGKPYRKDEGKKLVLVKMALLAAILFLVHTFFCQTLNSHNYSGEVELFKCQEFESVFGASAENISNIIFNEKLQNETMTKLANAVRVPTEIYDTFPNPQDEAEYAGWQPFIKLHKQLAKDFPLVWSKCKIEHVNHYALLITWEGSNNDLKPALFAAHQDVVPVDRKTWGSWKHEPFGGEWDGQFLWGRGSFDDKNMLIGILQAFEYIIQNEPDFNPERSLLLASGFDEEASGVYGARYLSDVLVERYGHDGIYSIIDEGVVGIKEVEGVLIAAPGTGEKGFINLVFDIRTPGGHSSVPPDHTSIGVAASIIHDIEGEKFPAQFTPENPVTQYYQCIAQYSETMENDVKIDFLKAMDDEKANKRVLDYLFEHGGKKTEYLFRSTQAFDIINGGIKANALPESVSFLLNSRVSIESNVNKTLEKFSESSCNVAKEYGLGCILDGEVILESTNKGTVYMDVQRTLEPAPVSPNNEVWREFAGSIKGFYESVVFPKKFGDEQKSLVVAPSIMTANTDTCHYWRSSKNIYRYQPGFAMDDTLSTIHSVNEHVDAETVMHVVGFIYNYIHLVNKL